MIVYCVGTLYLYSLKTNYPSKNRGPRWRQSQLNARLLQQSSEPLSTNNFGTLLNARSRSSIFTRLIPIYDLYKLIYTGNTSLILPISTLCSLGFRMHILVQYIRFSRKNRIILMIRKTRMLFYIQFIYKKKDIYCSPMHHSSFVFKRCLEILRLIRFDHPHWWTRERTCITQN